MAAPFQDELLLSYSDDELFGYICDSPRVQAPGNEPGPDVAVKILSSSYVAKSCRIEIIKDALKAIEVARQLGLHVPQVRRTLYFKRSAFYIMDRIQGPTLEEAWNGLGWLTTLKLALQLRHAVRMLRSVTSTTAGSLETGEIRSFYLDNYYRLPPRSTAKNITYFISFWANFTNIRNAIKTAAQTTFSPTKHVPAVASAMVLTHHDLAPRNMIVHPSGQLWLIDWDLAGFYPRYFEYAGTYNFNMPSNWSRKDKLRWTLFTWISAGRYKRERSVLEHMRRKFTRYSQGRRHSLLAVGGPSVHKAKED